MKSLEAPAMDPISTASSALLSASNRFENASNAVISAANSGGAGDLASAVVNQAAASQSVQADAAVLKTTNKLFNALLDITV
jgi:hypothetical protein